VELEAIRKYMHEHPSGIQIKLVDGRLYRIPHRDYVFFGPPRETLSAKRGVHGTSFFVFDEEIETMKLVNALLVIHVEPLKRNGNGKAHRKGGTKRG